MYPAPILYEICFRGRLDERHTRWFEDLTMMPLPDGLTLLSGYLPDQSALHGILSRLRDLRMELVSVRQVAEGQTTSPRPPDEPPTA